MPWVAARAVESMIAPRQLNRAFAVALLAALLIASRWDDRIRERPLEKPQVKPLSGNALALAAVPAAAALAPSFDAPSRAAPTLEDGSAASADDCRAKIRSAMSIAPAPGTPELDAARGRVLLYAKAEPVLFVRPPGYDIKGTKSAASYRSMLRRTKSPWSMIKQLWPVFSANPELGRSVLLREGYLYAEKPELAFALVDLVAAQLLFSDKHIWIQRGDRLLTAERTRTGQYAFDSGPERGERVRLLLFDRVGAGEPPPPLHRDFRSLRQRLGFDRARIVHLSEASIVADLRYGTGWVPSLLSTDGAHLELVCEAPHDGFRAALSQFRAEQAEKELVLEPLRNAMLAQIQEGLPFDEPKTEYGQQDGQLRSFWRRAYEAGKGLYKVNDDLYDVFNARGQPLVPQVCVDFIFDTFERAGGTWWRERGQPRERVVGKLDFATLTKEPLRRATSFIELAKSHPEWFDIYAVPERDRVAFKWGQQLSDYLTANADQFEPGDIVLIKGYAPWDKKWMPKIMHTHSFFVYESDPLSGMPLSLAGNPGRALLQTWQFEAFRTPERSIWYRIRPHTAWLRQIVKTLSDRPAALGPPPLTMEKKERAALRAVDTTEPAG